MIVWFHGSADAVSSAATMKLARIGVLDVAHQPARGHDLHQAQEEDQRRQLEHGDHAEHHVSIQAEGIFQLRRQLDRLGVELREELDRGREEQIVREQRAGDGAG